MNAVKAKFSQLATSIAPYSQTIVMVLYVIISLIIVYVIYIVLFPAPDDMAQVVLDETLAANSLGKDAISGLNTSLNSAIELTTGGEYTFQTWMFISNWDYRSNSPKHVFTIGSNAEASGGRSPHVNMVGILYPNENKLAIRVFQNPSDSQINPDITLNSTLSQVFSGGAASTSAFNQTVGYPICDIADLDLQKWICLSVVVNGRIVDVYIDGKLARSCVTKGIPTVEGPGGYVTMGSHGGWGGNISTTRMYGYALTPGQLYEIYQKGPADPNGLDPTNGFLGWLWKKIGLSAKVWSNASS